MDACARHWLSPRHRWHQRAPGAPHHVHHSARARLCLVLHRGSRERVRGHHARPGDGHAGRVRQPGCVSVLRLLGSDAHPHVPHHRGMGRDPARVRRRQVRPLHPGGLAAHAGGHPRPLLPARRHHRPLHLRSAHLGPLGDAHRARPEPHVPGLRAGLRHQGAPLSLPHVVARRPRGSSDTRQRHPGRGPPQDGDLRIPALLPAPISRRQLDLRAARVRPGRDRHHLRRLCVHRPA